MWDTLIRYIVHKAEINNISIIFADKWYPSSKLCSNCGHKKDVLKLSDRIYKCDHCGLVIDRDANAAKNLAILG